MSAVRIEADRGARLWPYLGLVDGELVEIESGEPAPAVARLAHDAFTGMINSPAFVCVGAKAAVSRETYRVGLLGGLGSGESAEALAAGLRAFEQERTAAENDFFTYIAFFTDPVGQDEVAFEKSLWDQLQRLHEQDCAGWDPDVSADPSDPHFSFSFNGHAYFVVGLHGASSRWARRFAWPTLVFNPHDQFDDLRDDGRMSRWQEVIRERDAELQGSPNPNLSDFGELPEARQYSGRRNPRDWQCPFHA
jgi:FPC/CPF motif-containing protein YcgG